MFVCECESLCVCVLGAGRGVWGDFLWCWTVLRLRSSRTNRSGVSSLTGPWIPAVQQLLHSCHRRRMVRPRRVYFAFSILGFKPPFNERGSRTSTSALSSFSSLTAIRASEKDNRGNTVWFISGPDWVTANVYLTSFQTLSSGSNANFVQLF